jgi:hypothetical protein
VFKIKKTFLLVAYNDEVREGRFYSEKNLQAEESRLKVVGQPFIKCRGIS